LLSLCFIDPFSAGLDFNVIRDLATAFRMERRLKVLTSRARERMEGNRPVESRSQIVSESKPPM